MRRSEMIHTYLNLRQALRLTLYLVQPNFFFKKKSVIAITTNDLVSSVLDVDEAHHSDSVNQVKYHTKLIINKTLKETAVYLSTF